MTEIELQLTVARIDENVQDMHHRLFGNGQPGELQQQDDRLTELEASWNKFRGVLWTLGALVSLLTSTTIVELVRGKL